MSTGSEDKRWDPADHPRVPAGHGRASGRFLSTVDQIMGLLGERPEAFDQSPSVISVQNPDVDLQPGIFRGFQRSGDLVEVGGSNGFFVRGRVVAVSPTVVSLRQGDGRPFDIPYTAVTSIRRAAAPSLANGDQVEVTGSQIEGEPYIPDRNGRHGEVSGYDPETGILDVITDAGRYRFHGRLTGFGSDGTATIACSMRTVEPSTPPRPCPSGSPARAAPLHGHLGTPVPAFEPPPSHGPQRLYRPDQIPTPGPTYSSAIGRVVTVQTRGGTVRGTGSSSRPLIVRSRCSSGTVATHGSTPR